MQHIDDSDAMHRVGSILVTAATAPLALGLAGDIYVVIGKISGPATGVAAAALSLGILVGLWYAYPLATAWARHSASQHISAKASGQPH